MSANYQEMIIRKISNEEVFIFERVLPLIKRIELTSIKECLVPEVNENDEKCFFTGLSRSPSQNPVDLEQFCTTFDLLF